MGIGRDDRHTDDHAVLIAGIERMGSSIIKMKTLSVMIRVRWIRINGENSANSSVLTTNSVDSIVRTPHNLILEFWGNTWSEVLDIASVA